MILNSAMRTLALGVAAASFLSFGASAASIEELSRLQGPEREKILIEGARAEGKVVMYSAMIENQALRPINDAFHRKYPFIEAEFWRADTRDLINKTLAEARARAMVADVAATCGRLDIVVHNAAAFGRRSIEEMDEALLDTLFNLNVKACFTLTQAALPHMRKLGGGRIIITSSVTGPKVSMPGSGAYATSKAAVTGFVHTAAIEFAADNITVNAIEPGYIDTPALTGLKARYGADNIAKYIPAKRLGRPEEIAGAMLFLASDESSYVTGETIVVDGGARLPESPVFAD